MKKYTRTTAPVDEERELRLAIMRQELRVLLWQRVAIPDALVHIAADLGGESTWQALKAAGDAPPRFMINRRVYVLIADLRKWIEERPKTTAVKSRRESKPLDNNDDEDANQSEANARPTFASALQAPRPSR